MRVKWSLIFVLTFSSLIFINYHAEAGLFETIGKTIDSTIKSAEKILSTPSNEGTETGNESSSQRPDTEPVTNYRLTILAVPEDAKIRILNIKPKYTPGILLNKGKYHVEVSKDNFETYEKWIHLNKNTTVKIALPPAFSSKTSQADHHTKALSAGPQKGQDHETKQTISRNSQAPDLQKKKLPSTKEPVAGKPEKKSFKARDEILFDTVLNQNTVEGFDDFLKKYPTSRFAVKAKSAKLHLLFEQAKQENSVAGYDNFLASLATINNGPNAYALSMSDPGDNIQIERIVFTRKHTLFHMIGKKTHGVIHPPRNYPHYNIHLNASKKSSYKLLGLWKDGKIIKKSIKNEKGKRFTLIYDLIKETRSPIDLIEGRYSNNGWHIKQIDLSKATQSTQLSVEATGPMASEILMRKEQALWKDAEQQKTYEGYAGYIDQYPSGKYISAASKALWKETRRQNNYDTYLKYIRHFPDGEYTDQALRQMTKVISANYAENSTDSFKGLWEVIHGGGSDKNHVEIISININDQQVTGFILSDADCNRFDPNFLIYSKRIPITGNIVKTSGNIKEFSITIKSHEYWTNHYLKATVDRKLEGKFKDQNHIVLKHIVNGKKGPDITLQRLSTDTWNIPAVSEPAVFFKKIYKHVVLQTIKKQIADHPPSLTRGEFEEKAIYNKRKQRMLSGLENNFKYADVILSSLPGNYYVKNFSVELPRYNMDKKRYENITATFSDCSDLDSVLSDSSFVKISYGQGVFQWHKPASIAINNIDYSVSPAEAQQLNACVKADIVFRYQGLVKYKYRGQERFRGKIAFLDKKLYPCKKRQFAFREMPDGSTTDAYLAASGKILFNMVENHAPTISLVSNGLSDKKKKQINDKIDLLKRISNILQEKQAGTKDHPDKKRLFTDAGYRKQLENSLNVLLDAIDNEF